MRSGGNVGINTNTPGATLDVVGTAHFSTSAIIGPPLNNPISANLEVKSTGLTQVEAISFGSGGCFIGQSANGLPAAPTATLQENELASLRGRGHDGSSFTGSRAAITMLASENWANNANGTDIAFSTMPEGTASLTEVMRLTENGDLGIGTTNPVASLHVARVGNIALGPPAVIVGGVEGVFQSQQIQFDAFGIQSANKNNFSTLFLNQEGGDVNIGATLTVQGSATVQGMLRMGSETGTSEAPNKRGSDRRAQ